MRLFRGRMNRSTYLLVWLVEILVSLTFRKYNLEQMIDDENVAVTLLVTAVVIPLIIWQFAATVRRAHDFGRTGWLSLLLFLPLSQLFFVLMPGQARKNAYGKPPTEHLDWSSALVDPQS